MRLIKFVFLFWLSVGLTGCIIFPLKESNPDRDLNWCLPRHTCASTEAVTFVHSIKPFKLAMPYEQAWPEIRNSVLALDNASIEHEYEGYIFAKTYTPVFHFLDYFEVLYIKDENRLNVRSSSLFGLTDFFTNYFRTQAFRTYLEEKGVILPINE
ncbi:DUF1499 domain-containing protein [Bermanella sp. WJH001]|uniref:DUF1499 domain-containing protein n=1 Tax=Bermanella sp. WJH001 TaxID=3048005 RepID=UPI0024BD8CAF|nr:DUF1499 domain-containing protein [Bermanella sp. WJH001]MDJ1537524.1 DUF1499 domain-containing protein [Bermanella sp. WJH001]